MHPSIQRAREMLRDLEGRCDEYLADSAMREYRRVQQLEPSRQWQAPERRQATPDPRLDIARAELLAELRAFVRAEIDAWRQEAKAYAYELCNVLADEARSHAREFDKRLGKLETALLEKAVKSK
jgi:hypothetical protein